MSRKACFSVVDLHHGTGLRDMKVWSIVYDRVYMHVDIERALQSARFRKYRFYGSHPS